MISEKLARDFLTTCVEGGYSNDWLACNSVERDSDLNAVKLVGCCDAEDPETCWGDADIETIRLGIARIIGGEVKVNHTIRGAALAVSLDEDDTCWDAETADCALQAGLLGSIVYG